jgi:adhesin transport system outer membrane protein
MIPRVSPGAAAVAEIRHAAERRTRTQANVTSASCKISRLRPIRPAVALLLAIGPLPAAALTLASFVSGAVESAPEVREQIHVYRQVVQDEAVALSGWRPSLDLSASYGVASRKAANTSQQRREFDSTEASVILSQNLFDGFNTTNQVKQARARITSAAYFLYDTADNVALTAVEAYLDALTQRQLTAYAAQNVESHERILGKIRELSDQGITRRSDVEQTEGRLARANASLIAQQNNLEDALTRLHKLLGRYVPADALVEPEWEASGPRDVQDLLDQALVVHPAIESARRNIDAARFDYERSKSADLPRLDLQLKQSLGNDVEGPVGRLNEGSVQLNLNYNLYRGGADRAEQRKRLSAMHANKTFLDRVHRQVIDALRLAWSSERALQEQLPYLARHVDKSLETLELYREEYLLQRRDLIDVLDAESELNSALSAHARARYSSVTAGFRLQESLGALFDAVNLKVDLGDDGFRLAGLDTRGVDAERIEADRDGDGLTDDKDQCDNSAGPVNRYGCAELAQLDLGYQGIDDGFDARPDRFETIRGQALTIAYSELLANDRSSDRPGLRITRFTQPENGEVAVQGEASLVYRPRPGFTGQDSFGYEVTDRRGRLGSTEVTVTVGHLAAAPGLPPSVLVRFDYKKLTLTRQSRAAVAEVLPALREDPRIVVEVLAYTDSIGSARYNRRLSRRRAEAMKSFLVEQGIDAARITASGMGESDPVADNDTEEGRALNRRGEFRFGLRKDG